MDSPFDPRQCKIMIMSDYYTQHFENFKPELLSLTGSAKALETQLSKHNILICGESHGVRENADIAFTLCHTLGIKHIAIERSETNFKNFIDSAISGKPNFMIPHVLQSVQASVLSIELLKAIVVLLQNGTIERISYVDIDHTNKENLNDLSVTEYMKVREEEIAHNIFNLDPPNPKLVILGNFHTRLEKDPGASFPSALQIIRKKLEVPCLTYDYLSGSQYNAGRKLHFKNRLANKDDGENKGTAAQIKKNSEVDFSIEIPVAHPIAT